MSSQIQSVVFKTDKPNTWTPQKAKVWLKDNRLSLLKGKSVDKTENSLRYRINDPKKYIDFRTKVVEGECGQINFIIHFSTFISFVNFITDNYIFTIFIYFISYIFFSTSYPINRNIISKSFKMSPKL